MFSGCRLLDAATGSCPSRTCSCCAALISKIASDLQRCNQTTYSPAKQHQILHEQNHHQTVRRSSSTTVLHETCISKCKSYSCGNISASWDISMLIWKTWAHISPVNMISNFRKLPIFLVCFASIKEKNVAMFFIFCWKCIFTGYFAQQKEFFCPGMPFFSFQQQFLKALQQDPELHQRKEMACNFSRGVA